MAKTKSTILDVTAQGYIMNPEIYGKIYQSFIDKNLDEQGNVIDDKVEHEQAEALRRQFHELDKRELSDCIEQMVQYESFGVSEQLGKFIDFCKRFVIAVEKEPHKLDEFLPHYLKRSELNIYKGGFDNGVKASLIDTINKYLDTVTVKTV